MWTCPPARIVVAVDFGPPSIAAARLAGWIARRAGATLTAVHAETLEAPSYFTADQIDAIEAQRTAARDLAERQLREVVAEAAGVTVEALVVSGPPTEVVLTAAEGADLIVVGTHGRRGPSRWWLGSVAERIARAADVPVLVVHDRPLPDDPVASVVVVEAPGLDTRAARCAAQLAALGKGRVRIVDAAAAAVAARAEGATLVAIPGHPHGADGLGSGLGTLIGSCQLPLLVVPEVSS